MCVAVALLLHVVRPFSRKKFVTVQPPENRPFIDEILEDMQTTIKHLEVSQIHVFYSAVGEIIQVEADPNKRQNLVFKLMELPNQTWAQLIAEANHDAQTLFNPVTVKRFILVLKTNNRVAGSLGPGYIVQLARIYVDMLQVYKMYSGYVSMRISEGGAIVTRTAVIRSMRTVKKETLNLIRTFVTQSVDMDREVILNNFIPALLDPVLQDYSRNVPDARDAEVLLLFAEVISKLGVSLIEPGHIQRIFESTFQATLDMITQNFEDHPDHRINFFKLIEAINRHAFPAMLRLNAKQFQLVIDSIIWAVKHLERNIADTGLQILYDLIDNVRMGEFGTTQAQRNTARLLSLSSFVRSFVFLTLLLVLLFVCCVRVSERFLQDLLHLAAAGHSGRAHGHAAQARIQTAVAHSREAIQHSGNGNHYGAAVGQCGQDTQQHERPDKPQERRSIDRSIDRPY